MISFLTKTLRKAKNLLFLNKLYSIYYKTFYLFIKIQNNDRKDDQAKTMLTFQKFC